MTHNLGSILTEGTRKVFYNSKFAILLWSVNLAFAFILSTPVYFILTDNLSHSLMGLRLLDNFDFIWFTQLKNLYKETFGAMPFVISGVVIVYSILQAFLSGGLLSILNNPKKNHTVDFFYGGVKYWFRFTKLLLISTSFYFIVLFINYLIGNLISELFRNYETVVYEFALRSLRYIFLIFFIGLVSIVSDYTRIIIVKKDSTKIFGSLKSGLFFTVKSIKFTVTTYFIVACFGALGATIYNLIGLYLPESPWYFFLISFILQQLLIIYRMMVKILFYSTELILYEDINSEVVKPKVKIIEQEI